MEKMSQEMSAIDNAVAPRPLQEGIVVKKEDKTKLKEELRNLKKEIEVINETKKRVDLSIFELNIPREAIPEYELEIAERPLEEKQKQAEALESKLKGNKSFIKKMQNFLFGI